MNDGCSSTIFLGAQIGANRFQTGFSFDRLGHAPGVGLNVWGGGGGGGGEGGGVVKNLNF